MLQSFKSISYVMNSDYLRGNCAIDLRTLKHLGFNVIVVNLTQWLEFPMEERAPFLMHEIQNCVEI